MRILFSSDLHGHIGAYKRFSELLSEEQFDLGILGGDLMSYSQDKEETERTIKEILHRARTRILFIMGNDDGILDYDWDDTELLNNCNMKRLPIGNHTFLGYQYTNPFVGGPFEKTEQLQREDLPILKGLIESSTVLVSHGPAFGTLDVTFSGDHVGSRALRTLVEESNPLFHLFGHIHHSAGIQGRSINGAYPDLGKFVSLDLDTETSVLVV